ncbi:MAG: hypothetical protein ABL930_12825 [Pseudobdellovibrio sp.]
MKNNLLKILIITVTLLSFSELALAQAKGNPSTAAKSSSRGSGNNPKIRLLATFDYSMINPSNLNDYRSTLLWSGTTRTQGTFNAMNGFTVGAAYLLGSGYAGLEYSGANQELTATTIPPGTFSVQDTIQYQTVYAVYDWVKSINNSSSYELGGGIGYAIKFEHHWVVKSGTGTDDVIWQANPVVAKLRAAYNYHFSQNVKARFGAAYEYATAPSLTADANHATGPITSGQTLQNSSNQNVSVDISGLRLNVGMIVAF